MATDAGSSEVFTELHAAVIDGSDCEYVLEFIANGANLDAKDDHGKTALILAAQYGHAGKFISD